jgi:cytosine/adenosine deaminase-related metal-dependent hydrolase
VYYWELLGLEADQVGATLEYLRYPRSPDLYGPRVTCGLSPHAPYTSGPGLLRAVHDAARGLGVPTAIHVAESRAEIDLLQDGSGPLAATAARTARGFVAPGSSPVRYLADVGALEGTTAVHLCHLVAEDIALLADQVRGAVTCPRSNRYLHNPAPAVAPLLAAGVRVGVGTDSSASNSDLDLMAEVRAIAAAEPEIGAEQLLALATSGGAQAIGVEDRFGSLAPGLQADLAAFTIAATSDPVSAVVRHAGSSTATAVMSAGIWRVRDGRLSCSDREAAEQAADARERSLQALRA